MFKDFEVGELIYKKEFDGEGHKLQISPALDRTNLEVLAAIQHEIWAHWMRYMWEVSETQDDGTLTIPASRVDRWERQMRTLYADLSEEEKESDRQIVRDFMPFLLW